ncbi:hypothetical protein ACWIFB_05250 [Dietzia sp. NPDC055340]
MHDPYAGSRDVDGDSEHSTNRLADQFWWPRCLEFSSRSAWTDVIASDHVDRAVLASCERLR